MLVSAFGGRWSRLGGGSAARRAARRPQRRVLGRNVGEPCATLQCFDDGAALALFQRYVSCLAACETTRLELRHEQRPPRAARAPIGGERGGSPRFTRL